MDRGKKIGACYRLSSEWKKTHQGAPGWSRGGVADPEPLARWGTCSEKKKKKKHISNHLWWPCESPDTEEESLPLAGWPLWPVFSLLLRRKGPLPHCGSGREAGMDGTWVGTAFNLPVFPPACYPQTGELRDYHQPGLLLSKRAREEACYAD